MRPIIIFLFSISSSFFVYSQQNKSIDELVDDIEQAEEKQNKIISRKENIKKTWENRAIFPAYCGDTEGIFVGISSIQGDQISSTDITNKYEIGYFDGYSNYFGFQFGVQGSSTIYQPDDGGSYNDSVWNLLYGRSLTNSGSILDAFFITLAIGYHSYNYDTTDTFGPFYDIGSDLYYALGAKIFLVDFDGVQALLDLNIDHNSNKNIGFGISINL